jgi:hypothetical protein
MLSEKNADIKKRYMWLAGWHFYIGIRKRDILNVFGGSTVNEKK